MFLSLTHVKRCKNIAHESEFFLRKVLRVRKFFLPLHPLNEEETSGGTKRKSSLKDLHRQK